MTRNLLHAAALGAILLSATPATAQLRVTKRADLAAPVTLESGQGAILVAIRRPDAESAGKSAALSFARYDPEGRDLILQPRDAKKKGDRTTYWVEVRSADKKLPVEYHLMPVSAGNYALYGATPGPNKMVMNSFCFGAPTFRVNAGEVVYFGDLVPYFGARMADGDSGSAMAYRADAEEARAALASQPALQAAFRPAQISNGATYFCTGESMLAYAVPGAPSLPAATAGAQ